MADEPVSQTFYVQALNIELTADKALISGDVTGPFESDVNAQVDVPLSVVQDLFKFQSDAIDINDVDIEDLKYKVDYTPDTTLDDNDIPLTVLAPGFLTNTLCYEAGTASNDTVFADNTSTATKKSVADDYMRFLAFKLFRTAMGVDLFDNEIQVKESINTKARAALDIKLAELTNLNDGGYLTKDESTTGEFEEVNHPTYSIISQMIANTPERFQNLDEYAVGDADTSGDEEGAPLPTFRAPLMAGDSLVFRLLIKADPLQGGIVNDDNGNINFEGGVAGSEGRVYAIKLNVVADGEGDGGLEGVGGEGGVVEPV